MESVKRRSQLGFSQRVSLVAKASPDKRSDQGRGSPMIQGPVEQGEVRGDHGGPFEG